jgi:hypothetical protein
MSTCAFCGTQRPFGHHFLAHRLSTSRLHTVKVCEGCLADARQSGYQIAERESGWASSVWAPEAGLRRPFDGGPARANPPITHP